MKLNQMKNTNNLKGAKDTYFSSVQNGGVNKDNTGMNNEAYSNHVAQHITKYTTMGKAGFNINLTSSGLS